VGKKRPARPSTTPNVTAGISATDSLQDVNRGFYIKDAISNHDFLVDTGASRSVYPVNPNERLQPNTATVRLIAANGSEIKTYGSREITMRLAGHDYAWNFVIADVHIPLLGADFLADHGLLVDVANRKLLNLETFHSTPLQSRPLNLHADAPANCANGFSITETAGKYYHIIQEFSDVFKPILRQPFNAAAKHQIYHHIVTTGAPVYSKFRRLSPEKLRAAKQAFAEMERAGLCRKAASPWASPLHMVKKSDGKSWRPCGDYRRLNLITEPDHYPLPNMADLTTSFSGAKIFSKLDLLKGYFQVPVHPDDINKTAIITPFGSYVFAYSTFGLRNAGATFQRMMDGIFGDLSYCVCYVDDILIFSKTEAEHHEHLKSVLQLLKDNGLVVKLDKCQFGVTTTEFLGHEISADGVRPLSSKVDAIQKFPAPSTVKGLQEFVGMVNYYHHFLPRIAHTMAPLYQALTGKQRTLIWEQDQQKAFEATKRALASAATLTFPQTGATLTLTTDASNVAVGAVVEQNVNGQPQPLGFFSRKLRPPETKYSTFDRELLAVYLAVRHFRHLLEGTPFTVRTDHRPLVHAFSKAGDAWSDRQQRHLSAIAEYNCEIEYLPGNKNPVADALSRIQLNAVQLGIDYKALAEAQANDPETRAYRTAITNLHWEDVPYDDYTLLCDVSTGRPRPLIPKQWRRKVFDIIHGLSHPSGRSTAKLLSNKYVWHGINRDARNWARCCLACQSSKTSRHTESGIGKFPQPKRRFGHLHVDIVGPLPPSDGAQYLFTCTERSTRWPEAIPMAEANAQSCARALLYGWISRFGVPEDITSDRGSAFTSQLWAALGELMGTTIHHTTAYNPAANGMAERTHRTLKSALMARCTGPDWHAQLPWVLLGMRTTPKEGLGFSPAEMVFGETIAVPGEFFPSSPNASETSRLTDLRRTVGRFRPCQQTYTDNRRQHIPRSLGSSTHVFIRNDAHTIPLTRPYRGPYAVIERGAKAYRININGRQDWVSIDRLKPAYLDEDKPAPVTMSRTGRAVHPPNRLDL